MAATRHEDDDDMVADLKVGHACPQFLDDAGGLMAERHRHRTGPVAVDDGQVGVAKTRRRDLDQHFVGARRRQIDLFDVQGTRVGVRGAAPIACRTAALIFIVSPRVTRFLSSSTSTRLFSE